MNISIAEYLIALILFDSFSIGSHSNVNFAGIKKRLHSRSCAHDVAAICTPYPAALPATGDNAVCPLIGFTVPYRAYLTAYHIAFIH
jgi:hypothetical protein